MCLNKQVNRHNRRVRCRRQVALCAVTAAPRLVFGMKTSITAEAARTRSTPAHVTAAITILKSEDRSSSTKCCVGRLP